MCILFSVSTSTLKAWSIDRRGFASDLPRRLVYGIYMLMLISITQSDPMESNSDGMSQRPERMAHSPCRTDL